MPAHETIEDDAETLAIAALAWTLSDDSRAQRLLDLTGIAADDLRRLASHPSTLDAVLSFLEGYQPDLVACARALGVQPERLVSARERLKA